MYREANPHILVSLGCSTYFIAKSCRKNIVLIYAKNMHRHEKTVVENLISNNIVLTIF